MLAKINKCTVTYYRQDIHIVRKQAWPKFCLASTFFLLIKVLARSDVEADWRWVVVLEVGKGSVPRSLELKADSRSSRTRESGDIVRVARSHRSDTIVSFD
jgi:hypothetical protein